MTSKSLNRLNRHIDEVHLSTPTTATPTIFTADPAETVLSWFKQAQTTLTQGTFQSKQSAGTPSTSQPQSQPQTSRTTWQEILQIDKLSEGIKGGTLFELNSDESDQDGVHYGEER
eukprot:jgi/Hompol1/5414/HPOL_004393-RA